MEEKLKFPAGQSDVTELRWQIATTLLRESGKLHDSTANKL